MYLQSSGDGKQKHIIVCKVNSEEREAKKKAAFEKKLVSFKSFFLLFVVEFWEKISVVCFS